MKEKSGFHSDLVLPEQEYSQDFKTTAGKLTTTTISPDSNHRGGTRKEKIKGKSR